MGRGYLGWILERGISTVSPPWSNFYNIEKVQVKKKIGNQKYIFFCLLQTTKEFLLICLHFYSIIRDCFRLFFALFTVNLWRIFLAFKTFFIIFANFLCGAPKGRSIRSFRRKLRKICSFALWRTCIANPYHPSDSKKFRAMFQSL